MFNPLYVTTSRHGVYYLRYPIPLNLHPERLQSHVKLSLATRCPKEALHLARGLCYVGEHVISQMKAAAMDYYAIKAFLTQFFKERLVVMQQRISQHGPAAVDRTALQNSYAFAKQELEDKSYYLTGTNAQINQLIEEHDLPISGSSETYELLRVEFVKAFKSYCKKALDDSSNLDDYNFDDVVVPAVAVPKKKGRSLSEAVDEYISEKIRLKAWRETSKQDYQSKFDLLLRYFGKDSELELPLEKAISLKSVLLTIPSHSNTKPEMKDKPIEELVKMEGKRLSPVTVNKYIQTYSGF